MINKESEAINNLYETKQSIETIINESGIIIILKLIIHLIEGRIKDKEIKEIRTR